MATIPAALTDALQHHRSGQLEQAGRLYEEVLRIDPSHPDALHLLGVIDHQQGKHRQAAERITRAITLNPDVPSYYGNLGAVYRSLGEPDRAVSSFRQAVRIGADYADAHYNLGNVLADQGEFAEAAASFRHVLRIQPENVDALNSLGHALRNLGELDEAETCYRRAVQLQPDSSPTLNGLGSVLQDQEKLDEAEVWYRRALAVTPDYPAALNNLANMLSKRKQLDEAEIYYRRALQLKPDSFHASNGLAGILFRRKQPHEAIALYRRAIQIEPNYAEAYNNLGVALLRTRNLDSAENCFRKAVELKPEYADALANLARALEKHNRVREAAAAAAECLRMAPDHAGATMIAATCQRRQGRHQAAIAQLEALRPRVDPDDGLMNTVLYELGLAYDHVGETAKAFDCVADANKLAASQSEHEIAEGKRRCLDLIELSRRAFTRRWVDHWSPAVPLDEGRSPAFLIGFPRSGTTLLDVILDSHPRIQTAEEKPMVLEMMKQVESLPGGYPTALADLTPSTVQSLRATYSRELAQHLDFRPENLLVDKLPINSSAVGLILRVFPTARFVMMVRHPCDVCLSCFMQNFVLNDSTASFFTLEDTATLYDKVMRLWRQYVDLLPHAYHLLKYEDLVEDFEGQTRRVLQFLGVDWDQDLHRYTEHARQRRNGWIHTASYQQVIEPIYRRACGRWRKYAGQLAPVMDVLKPHIEYYGYDS